MSIHACVSSAVVVISSWSFLFADYVLPDVSPACACHCQPERGAFSGISVDIAAYGGRHLGAEISREFKEEFEQFVRVVVAD